MIYQYTSQLTSIITKKYHCVIPYSGVCKQYNDSVLTSLSFLKHLSATDQYRWDPMAVNSTSDLHIHRNIHVLKSKLTSFSHIHDFFSFFQKMLEIGTCSYSETRKSNNFFHFSLMPEDFWANVVKGGVLNQNTGCYIPITVVMRQINSRCNILKNGNKNMFYSKSFQ